MKAIFDILLTSISTIFLVGCATKLPSSITLGLGGLYSTSDVPTSAFAGDLAFGISPVPKYDLQILFAGELKNPPTFTASPINQSIIDFGGIKLDYYMNPNLAVGIVGGATEMFASVQTGGQIYHDYIYRPSVGISASFSKEIYKLDNARREGSVNLGMEIATLYVPGVSGNGFNYQGTSFTWEIDQSIVGMATVFIKIMGWSSSLSQENATPTNNGKQ